MNETDYRSWEVEELGIESNCFLSIPSHMDSISQSATKRSQTLDRVAVNEIGC
jgi:hypothetical protein